MNLRLLAAIVAVAATAAADPVYAWNFRFRHNNGKVFQSTNPMLETALVLWPGAHWECTKTKISLTEDRDYISGVTCVSPTNWVVVAARCSADTPMTDMAYAKVGDLKGHVEIMASCTPATTPTKTRTSHSL